MSPSDVIEANFDGLPGPTHNHAALSYGNLASTRNAYKVSNPRLAALQGLAKMRALKDMGLVQGFLPPHQRPYLPALRAWGFTGGDAEVIAAAAKADHRLLAAVYSAAAMWTANAATVSPSADTVDGKLHMTAANLAYNVHRAIEAEQTSALLRLAFPDPARFVHHPPVPFFADEGAANHARLAPAHGAPGVEVFVYGRDGNANEGRFPARQDLRASAVVARTHGLTRERCAFWKQSVAAIDAGAFHNDVVSVANEGVLFAHEDAFATKPDLPEGCRLIEVPSSAVPLTDAVASYLFNSQLVTLPDGEMALILPGETQTTASVKAYLTSCPIVRQHVFDVRESMSNGGGPACLRLRVVLTPAERAAVNPAFLLKDDADFARLEDWVRRHYRDRLSPDDLADPAFMTETFAALDDLTALLGLGGIYPFQR